MNVERLKALSNLLRADAANPKGAKFDLAAWSGYDDGHGNNNHNYVLDRKGKPTKTPTMSCDTFVCALGLAALDPEFNKAGLNFTVMPRQRGDTAWMVPEFNGSTGMEAGALFFEISVNDSQYLFDPSCYDHAIEEAEGELIVAERVDNLINGIVDNVQHPDSSYDSDNDNDEDDSSYDSDSDNDNDNDEDDSED